MNKQQKERLIHVLIIVAIIFISGIILLVMPSLGMKYICPLKEYLGIDCPGCGGTRMIMSILQGEWLQAFRYNPFLFITLIPLGLLCVGQSLKYINVGDFSYWLDKVLVTYAIALLAFGVARNIEAFHWLKPTVI